MADKRPVAPPPPPPPPSGHRNVLGSDGGKPKPKA